jgi:acetyltransferase-like isoleucine patch superfamily enzyme
MMAIKSVLIYLFIFLVMQDLFTVEENVLPNSFQCMCGDSLVTIGKFTYGYTRLQIEYPMGEPLIIGNFVCIAGNVAIYLGGNHHTDWISAYPFGQGCKQYFSFVDLKNHPISKGPVIIGSDVWIGNSVIIMSGVTIGDGAIIAANSVVTKNVDSYAIVGGNPAKLIRYRFDEEIRFLLQKLKWWDLQNEQIEEIAQDLCKIPETEKIKYWIKKYRDWEI